MGREALLINLTNILRGLSEKYALQVEKTIKRKKAKKKGKKSTRGPRQKVLFQLMRRKGGSLESTVGSIKAEICAL